MSTIYTGITIDQRACYDLTLNIQQNGEVYNLSGVNLTGQIRRNFDDALQAVFKTEVLNVSSGIAKISLTAEETQNIDLAPCYWDLYADKAGECPDKLLEGPVYVIKNATKINTDTSEIENNESILNNLVFISEDQTINGQKTFTQGIEINSTNHQITLGTGDGGNKIILTTPLNIVGNRTYTIPDIGNSAAFVLTNGNQTINGIKTFDQRPLVNGTGVLLIGEGSAPENVVYQTGDQAISGVKTFANNIIGSGTDNLFVNEYGFSPHSLLTQQQLMLGGHKFRQLVNVNSKVTGVNTNTNAGAFQVLGMKASVAAVNNHSAAAYTLDNVFCSDASTANMPLNIEIDTYFHGTAFQFQADSNWVARIKFGVAYNQTVPFANSPAATNKQWGVEFYHSNSNFYGRLYYYNTSIVYGDPFVLPIYVGAIASAWAGFIYSIRMRQVPFGTNQLRLEFYINESSSNSGGTALSKTNPTATLETTTLSGTRFDGKHINFEIASDALLNPSNTVRMQCSNIYCQFK